MGDHQNSVDMIRHDDEFIQFHMREMDRYVMPTLLKNPRGIVQLHYTISNIPEQARPALGTDGNKIRPGLGIIVSQQANGTAISLG
jgi:hypothetical protein